MKVYESMIEKTKRTLRVDGNLAEMDIMVLQEGKWKKHVSMRYTPEIIKTLGFETYEEFIAWKINRNGMEEVTP